eukprot:Selendium_serpulae@DN9423_c0_g1_i1.p1
MIKKTAVILAFVVAALTGSNTQFRTAGLARASEEVAAQAPEPERSLSPELCVGGPGGICEICEDSIVDLIFVVDSSSSILQREWYFIKDFMMTVVEGLAVGEVLTRVGLMHYGTVPKINFHLNQFFWKENVLSAIRRAQPQTGISNAHLAFDAVHDEMILKRNGRRRRTPLLMIYMSDGLSYDHDKTMESMNRLKREDPLLYIHSMAIGDCRRLHEMKKICDLTRPPADPPRLAWCLNCLEVVGKCEELGDLAGPIIAALMCLPC